jgi:hypothetical protein
MLSLPCCAEILALTTECATFLVSSRNETETCARRRRFRNPPAEAIT